VVLDNFVNERPIDITKLNPQQEKVLTGILFGDPRKTRLTEEFDTNLEHLGVVAGASAGFGLLNAGINAIQDDEDTSVRSDVLGPMAVTAPAALAAGYLGRKSVQDSPGYYGRLSKTANPETFERRLGGHVKRLDDRRNRRGLQAGAATAGAITLLNLLGALG